METHTDAMKINVSETTYHLVKSKFEFIEREAESVKGLGEMKMYFVDE